MQKLYPGNTGASFDEKLFAHPTAAYRGTPFWSWNSQLKIDQLLRQIEQFKTMGMGGFHMHPRTGMTTAYLGEDYFKAVNACVEKARQMDMLAWLYDEDRWPSGFAGGLVTKTERYRARYLMFTASRYGAGKGAAHEGSNAVASRNEGGRLLACYEVQLAGGDLAHYRRIDPDAAAAPDHTKWWTYLEVQQPSAWYNNLTYVDTLNPRAIERFVEVTHEAYARHLSKDFGGVVPAIFTDEPQFTRKQSLQCATDAKDVCLPFTDDLFDTYQSAYGERLEEFLPELIWNLPGGRASRARYRYHDHVAERFAAAFADTCGRWCQKNGIAFTGHLMEEATLQSQTAALGEAMRSYRAFHIPGIDMLCDNREYNTAKQAQSACHQYGREAVLSELYGVTNWNYDFCGHFSQGNWQAALGVTVRVHHLMWQSMAGESKRDYPASMGYQSPWWQEYPFVEDYFARVNTLLTRGKPVVRIGVIHPVESYWLAFGPADQSKAERETRESNFSRVTDLLLFALLDFDFISESLLPSQSEAKQDATFHVGCMDYDAVVVPAMRTIRSTTLERLETFATAGGTVIFAGEIPSLVDAEPSDRPARLAARCQQVELTEAALLPALEPFRELSSRGNLLYQMRQDGANRHLFICDTRRAQGIDGIRSHSWGETNLRLRGEWAVMFRDAFSGKSEPWAADYADGWTLVRANIPAAGGLLLTLSPGRQTAGTRADLRSWIETSRLDDPVAVSLSEPNVLLLDQAEWRLVGDEHWQPAEEILRLDNLVRARLALPVRTGHICQPWADTAPSPVLAEVEMRFTVRSEVPVPGAHLAAELPPGSTMRVGEQSVPLLPDGWWTDEAIETYPLPTLPAGTHELVLRIPFKRLPGLEWCYLLGNFGVRVAGKRARIIAPVRQLSFGDWTTQGLPFYGGNVTYHCKLQAAGDHETAIDVFNFRAPLVVAYLDGVKQSPIALPPYRLNLGRLKPGPHDLDLTVFGNRINCFGQVHLRDPNYTWFGPASWRSSGNAWAYEYQLKPSGILQAPVLRRPEIQAACSSPLRAGTMQ